MKVVVNGRFLTRRMAGVDRFAYEVLSAIDSLYACGADVVTGLKFEIVVPEELRQLPAFGSIKVRRTGTLKGQLWEQFHLPRTIKSSDLLLNLCNTGPVVSHQQVVVIHDAATVRIPMAFSRSFRLWYRVLMPTLGCMARRVLTVSEFSRGEIGRAFGIPAGKMSVVVEGGEHILRMSVATDAIARFNLGARPFVLAVSSMAAHKNFRLVLDALAKLPDAPFDVAIAGGANSKVFGEAGHLQSDRVHWLGYVSDEELRALYESAMCFVFPSIYEGFGIPPLEAMQCGCPVLAARAASIPEVCGDAALYFDPHDAKQLSDLLIRLAGDAELRAELSARGRARASLFSWEKAARQVVAACREAMR